MEVTAPVTAAPAAAPAAPAPAAPAPAAAPSTPTPSQSVDYSKTSDDAILDDAFGPKEKPADEPPVDDTEVKPSVETKPAVDDLKKDEPAEEDPTAPVPEDLKRIFKTHPEARAAWYRDQQFRESFATPAEARAYRQMFPTQEYAQQVLVQAQTLLDADRLFQTDPATFTQKLSEGNVPAFFQVLKEARNVAYSTDPAQYGEVYAKPVAMDIGANLRRIAAETGDADLNTALDIVAEYLGMAEAAPSAAAGPVDPRIADYERLRSSAQLAQAQARQSFSQTLLGDLEGGIRGVVTELVGKPAGVPEKALSRAVEDIVTDLYDVLGKNGHVSRTVENMQRQGDLSPAHRKQIVDFVLSHTRQVAPTKVKAHLNEWTTNLLQINKEQLSRAAQPNRRDVGTSNPSGAPNASRSGGPIDYKKVSDDDIMADRY